MQGGLYHVNLSYVAIWIRIAPSNAKSAKDERFSLWMGLPSRIVARAEGNHTGSEGGKRSHSALLASQSSFEHGISHLNSLRFAIPTDSSENIRYVDVWIIIQKQALSRSVKVTCFQELPFESLDLDPCFPCSRFNER